MRVTKEHPVLIVGAGPAGLVLGIELARRRVPLRIIDSNEAPVLASRAKGVQPRTLEIFEDLGVVEEVILGGAEFPRWRSYEGDRLLWEKSVYEILGRAAIPAPTIDRPYPATWMIPQWRTEEILRRRLAALGIEVELGSKFDRLRQSPDGVVAFIRAHAREEELQCSYLVGADGARSQVRKALAIPFTGETNEHERYIIADVQAEALEKQYWLNWSIGGDSVRRIPMCPLPRSDYFQVVAPPTRSTSSTSISIDAPANF